MRLERLKILETFEVMTPEGLVRAKGFRIDDLFALTPAILSTGPTGEPGFVTHLPTGYSPHNDFFFTFKQACLFVRLLRALPIDWNFKSGDGTKGSGVHHSIIHDLADIAATVIQ